MEKQTDIKINDFIYTEMLNSEKRVFLGLILSSSVVYFLITVWLNSIRTTAPISFVWILIIIQFALYFSIFGISYRRSLVLGLNSNVAFFAFVILIVLGRVNDWELVVIPLLVIIMLILSTNNKKVSEKWLSIFSEKSKEKSNTSNDSQNEINKPVIPNVVSKASKNYQQDSEISEKIIGITLGIIIFGGVFFLIGH